MAGENGSSVHNATGSSTCDRASGTQPRNRQHRASQYYFGNRNATFNVGMNPVQVTSFNPYRTQLIFTGFLSSAMQSIYIKPVILSYPIHGPLVIENWWAVFDGCPAIRLANTQANATGNVFALSIPIEGGGSGLTPLTGTLQVGEYYTSD